MFSNRVAPMHALLREKLAQMNTYAQENISGNRVVKAFAREENEFQRFSAAAKKVMEIYYSEPKIKDSDTIKGNIAYGNSDITIDEIRKYAKYSAVSDFISKMPEGYDMVVGERGVGFSGGQKQRISTTKEADHILVMQNGYIKEAGTHEELMAKRGYYYRLYTAQLDEIQKKGA